MYYYSHSLGKQTITLSNFSIHRYVRTYLYVYNYICDNKIDSWFELSSITVPIYTIILTLLNKSCYKWFINILDRNKMSFKHKISFCFSCNSYSTWKEKGSSLTLFQYKPYRSEKKIWISSLIKWSEIIGSKYIDVMWYL